MTDRFVHNLNLGKSLLLAAAGTAALTAPILIGIVHAPPVRAQPQPEKPLAFEVASVKPNKTADPHNFGTIKGQPGGRLTITGALST
jgi:hypothetical protein